MKKEKKEIVRYLSKTAFLLGRRRRDNQKIFLEAGSWDSGYYWGFGYLVIYNKPKTDIRENYHFKDLPEEGGLDGINQHFETFVLKGDDIWILIDLMRSYYILKEAAEFYYWGDSNFISKVWKRKSPQLHQEINYTIDSIIKQVEDMLSPN